MHNDDSMSGTKNKPEIIHYYNSMKGDVDNMDKMVTYYSTKRRTCRWLPVMFYNMIDVACLASYIIHTSKNPLAKKYLFQELEKSLAMHSIESRSQMPYVVKIFSTRLAIESMLSHPIIRAPPASTSAVYS
ncbi:hypothetical protein ILUMI_02824 [Ignelater luminosus]|uniref:PiggyBac transposable element-derived protein domain-containing protein n=1 Tax=Ignelater luminosus TaxID=2038154 RepID=A0A8K0GIX3_IGNLU|nr:hypothetical protein ILUMI_02824 [Ignelater luminosus]